MSRRTAFTYLELMIVVVIMAIVSLVALSTSNAAASEQGRLAGELFAGDVAYARSLAIARPDDPVVIKVDVAGNRYWLARAATPDTPITHPLTHQPYMVSFGPAGNTGLTQVHVLALDFGGDNVLGFNSLGTTDQQTAAVVQVGSAGQAYEIDVSPIGARTRVNRGLLTQLQATEAPAEALAAAGQSAGGQAAAAAAQSK